jgi:hypothetical protein
MMGMTLRVWVAVVLVLCAADRVRGHEETDQYTSFATIEIRPPFIKGTVWLPLRPIESLYPMDRDGDMAYTAAEVWAVRRPVTAYLNQGLLFMWQGRIHPVEVDRMEVSRRPGVGQDFLKVSLEIRDLPPGAPVEIVSQLLQERSPSAKCLALIRLGELRQVFVLGPSDYYRSVSSPLPAAPDSVYRPRAQRGRLALAGDLHIEMLYAVPQGAFYLYTLGPDREAPRGITSVPISASIRPKGDEDAPASQVLAPRPLSVDAPGRCSRFVGLAPQFKQAQVQTFSADLTFGSGKDRRRVLLDFPVVTVLPAAAAARVSRRYACSRLCLGVESKDKSAKCMRCGSELLEVHGSAVPGVGRIGRHGGMLRTLGRGDVQVEAWLPSRDEVRFYLTDKAMRPLPVKKVNCLARAGSSQRPEEARVGLDVRASSAGDYLTAKIPAKMALPIQVQCQLDLGGEDGPRLVEFHLHEVIEPIK